MSLFWCFGKDVGGGCWGGLCWCEWASCEACRDGSTETDVSVSRQQVLCGQRLWKPSRSPASLSRDGCAGGGQELGTGSLREEGCEQHAGTPNLGFHIPVWTIRFLLELLASRLTWGGTRTGILFMSAMCWDSSLSYDAAAIIYLRHSRPVHATPTVCLQIAYGSLRGSMVSPSLVFPQCDLLCGPQRRGPAVMEPVGSLLVCRLPCVVCESPVLALPVQLPISYRNPWLLSSVR